ncbi:hypothetical protein ACFOD0_15845 [Shewanella intestini]|uniref:Uncharacterized protein n=2 Tax=Shewanella TaxID=22 RepID=A0ABS5I6V5_9GAMM|nr:MULTISPECIES: hypothetical protein [Shewanella]ARD22990.1 hypothetical protein SJ2017_2704 [Shewanella japonica]MBR9729651.1 hypothetical protein [Shewanella intestini]MRG37728.1 hypothetical protein [Shewanella sp. XMDDZSB0408]
MNSEIIENLRFLISSAKDRDIEQGVSTFNSYIEKLSSTSSEKLVCEDLYRELSGMQRFADFNTKEWQAVQAIFNAIETNR